MVNKSAYRECQLFQSQQGSNGIHCEQTPEQTESVSLQIRNHSMIAGYEQHLHTENQLHTDLYCEGSGVTQILESKVTYGVVLLIHGLIKKIKEARLILLVWSMQMFWFITIYFNYVFVWKLKIQALNFCWDCWKIKNRNSFLLNHVIEHTFEFKLPLRI